MTSSKIKTRTHKLPRKNSESSSKKTDKITIAKPQLLKTLQIQIEKKSPGIPELVESKIGLATHFIEALHDRFMGPKQIISTPVLLEFLSEFLAVEQGGIRLYTIALGRSTDSELQIAYKSYLAQTRNHERVLTEAIEKLQGDPSQKSPGALAQEKLVETLLNAEIPRELRELKDAENLLLAETKDHQDWAFLKRISAQVEDEAKVVLSEMVGQIEDEEDEHLSFARKTVEKLSLRVAIAKSKALSGSTKVDAA
jgi:rubrerythrin